MFSAGVVFKVGDVVQLKSGGPLVTVHDVKDEEYPNYDSTTGKYTKLTFMWFTHSGEYKWGEGDAEAFVAYVKPPLMQVTTRDDGSVDISIVPEGN